jgi:hypothetical protein
MGGIPRTKGAPSSARADKHPQPVAALLFTMTGPAFQTFFILFIVFVPPLGAVIGTLISRKKSVHPKPAIPHTHI